NSEPIEIHYIRMHENTGGAGGFHEGLKRAYEKGYDWFWLMDDDVEPITEALDIQLKYEDISLCIHPSKKYTDGELYVWEGYIDEGSGHCFHKKEEEFRKEKNWTCVNTGCFEGMLIHRKVVSKIGFPLKELFTYSDDTYYGYLASKVTQNIYISEICFIKKIKPSQERLFLPNYIYLYSRNYLGYVARKITKNKKIYYVMTFSIILNLIIKFLIRSRYDSIFWLLLGYIHGLNENWSFYKSYFSKKTVQRGQF
ncbi:MAG: glycosyltransferase, partial [bacterium]